MAMHAAPNLVLSTSSELRLPLRWIAILRPHFQKTSLAATSGVHRAEDAIKLLLAGADVTMIASVLYNHGVNHARTLLDGIRAWMEEKQYRSVTQMKGSMSQINAPDPAGFERANYIATLVSFNGTKGVS
jgi:dihydroorotate dehydrogenase (fumarate)